MTINKSEIEHVAMLARLKLDGEELVRFTSQIGDVLSYVEKLNELDTTGVEPTSHVFDIKNVFRNDVLGESLSLKKALSNAPEATEKYYKVPKIIDQ